MRRDLYKAQRNDIYWQKEEKWQNLRNFFSICRQLEGAGTKFLKKTIILVQCGKRSCLQFLNILINITPHRNIENKAQKIFSASIKYL